MTAEDFHAYAGEKLRRVLGDAKGDLALAEALAHLGLRRIGTAEDLHRLGRELVTHGGFAGAVGNLLSVHAIIRGARAA